MKQLFMAFMAGTVVTGATLGTLGYFYIGDLNAEKTELQTLTKKQSWRLENLTDSQTRLQNELQNLKEQRKKTYDTTITSLMQAKNNAGLEALYEMGNKAFAEKDYPRAYFALAQVIKANPQYKNIAKEFPAVKTAYEKHRKDLSAQLLKTTYGKALDAQAKEQFGQAKAAYEEVIRLQADYKDAKQRLATVTRQLDTRNKALAQSQKKKWLSETYKVGFNHQAIGRYADAKAAYQQVVNYAPNYKDAAKRLKTVASKVPVPVSTPVPVAATGNNCYQLGMTVGRCGSNPNNPGCANLQSSAQIAACKNNPEFVKGYQTTLNAGAATTPGAGTNPDPNGMLKGISSLLKNL